METTFVMRARDESRVYLNLPGLTCKVWAQRGIKGRFSIDHNSRSKYDFPTYGVSQAGGRAGCLLDIACSEFDKAMMDRGYGYASTWDDLLELAAGKSKAIKEEEEEDVLECAECLSELKIVDGACDNCGEVV